MTSAVKISLSFILVTTVYALFFASLFSDWLYQRLVRGGVVYLDTELLYMEKALRGKRQTHISAFQTLSH